MVEQGLEGVTLLFGQGRSFKGSPNSGSPLGYHDPAYRDRGRGRCTEVNIFITDLIEDGVNACANRIDHEDIYPWRVEPIHDLTTR